MRSSASLPPISVSEWTRPRCGIVGPAPDPVEAALLAVQQVVDRDAQRGAQPHQRRQRQAPLGALDLRDRAGGHAREVAELVLAELARAPDGAQRGGDAARRSPAAPAPAGPSSSCQCSTEPRTASSRASAFATCTLRSSTRSTHCVTARTVSCTVAGVAARSSTSRRSRRPRAAAGSSGRRSRACGSGPRRAPSCPATRTAAAGGRAAGRAGGSRAAARRAALCSASMTASPGMPYVLTARPSETNVFVSNGLARDRAVERLDRRAVELPDDVVAPVEPAEHPVERIEARAHPLVDRAVKHCCHRQHVTNARAHQGRRTRDGHASHAAPSAGFRTLTMLESACERLKRCCWRLDTRLVAGESWRRERAREATDEYLGRRRTARPVDQRDDAGVAERARENPLLDFVDSCLRGVGQVCFMNNPRHRAGDPGGDVRRRAVARLRRRAGPRRLEPRPRS